MLLFEHKSKQEVAPTTKGGAPAVEEAVMAAPEAGLAVEEVALAQHQVAPLPKSKFVKNLSKSLLN